MAIMIFFKSNSAFAQFFSLQNYIINAPSCSISDDLNVHCGFSNIEPFDGNIASFITGFDNCRGSAARDSELSLSTATQIATNGTFNVIIDINTTNFNLTNGESEIYTFCLLTHLRDENDILMFWQGQKINATFMVSGNFTVVSDLLTQAIYKAANDTAANDTAVEEADAGSKISFTSVGLVIIMTLLNTYL